MDRFDVAIVGAGPAGCRAAFRMAGAGARVAIVDGSHPREKPCGGGVTARALDLVRDAIDPRDVAAVPIETATFEHGARRTAHGSRAAQPLVVVSRRQFDGALLAAASRGRGAPDLRAGHRRHPARDGWVVATRDGALSAAVAARRGRTEQPRETTGAAAVRSRRSVDRDRVLRARPDLARDRDRVRRGPPAGYLWSFPRHDHLAVGVCAQADESSSAALLSSASRWIGRNVEGPVELVRYSWPIPSLRVAALHREQPAGPRWMLLGDAGGMVDPITREGIFFALLSADAAADSLLGGDDPAAQYSRRVRASIHPELIRAARLKDRFFTPRFTGLMIRALEESAAIRHVMCRPHRRTADLPRAPSATTWGRWRFD